MSRREKERLDSDREVQCRIDGREFRGVLYNVSEGGCMIETALGQYISEGDRINLKAVGNIRMSGIVLWKQERNAGVRFDQPLHDAAVRFLGYEKAAMPIEWGVATDKFGRVLPRLSGRERVS